MACEAQGSEEELVARGPGSSPGCHGFLVWVVVVGKRLWRTDVEECPGRRWRYGAPAIPPRRTNLPVAISLLSTEGSPRQNLEVRVSRVCSRRQERLSPPTRVCKALVECSYSYQISPSRCGDDQVHVLEPPFLSRPAERTKSAIYQRSCERKLLRAVPQKKDI